MSTTAHASQAPDADAKPVAPSVLAPSRRILYYARLHWRVSLLLGLTLVVEVAFDNLFPLGVKFLIDTAVELRDATVFVAILVGLALIFIVSAVAGVGREHLSAVLASRAMRDLRSALFRHLQTLSASFYAHREVGDLLARFSGDLAAIEQAYVRSMPLAVYSVAGTVTSAVLLFVLDWRLALVTMVVLPVSFIGPRLFAGRATEAGYQRKTVEGQVTSTAQEMIGGHQVIRAFGLQRLSQFRFEGQLATLLKASHRATFLQRLVARTTSIGVIFGQLVIIGFGTLLVFWETMTIGTLVGFIGILLNLGSAVSGVAAAFPEWLQAISGMQRVDELLSEEPQVSDSPGAVELPRIEREIRFDRVSFSYTGETVNLHDVSLTIPAGQQVAFVGRSGSGKSTVFNLITRFYEPTEGVVSIDGHDLRAVTQESLRDQMGVVFQDSFLFKGSIRDNIRLGKPDATDEEIEAVARDAQIHDLVVSWPQGYDTDVGERGARLSGGQRQRIALARALLRDPSILLLDEATSALDPATEAAFNETLVRISPGRTVVSITHRLSGALHADQIFVLEGGRLAESGTHQELLAAEGVYAGLWRQQQEGIVISEDGRRAEVTAARLRTIPLFSGVDEHGLASIAERFSTERVPEGRDVFQQGDPGDKFYLIAHGSVEVLRSDEGGSERRLAVLQDGDVFGEMALLNDAPRSARIHTRTPCVLLTLSAQQFSLVMETEPALRRAMEELAQARVAAESARTR